MYESESATASDSYIRGDGHRDAPEIERRYATKADLERFYGEPIPWTVRAMVVTEDGFPKAVMGVARHYTMARAFFDYDEGVNIDSVPYKRALVEGLKFVRESKLTVYAHAEHETGAKLLERLGFEPWYEDFYLWHN